jgi:hypothetical protein
MELEILAKVNPTSRRVVLGASILIAAAAAYNWMVVPEASQVLAVQRYKDTLDEVAKKKESLQNITAKKKEKLKKLHEQLGELRGVFFTELQAREFLSDLQAISVEEGCMPFSIVMDPKKAGSNRPDKQNVSGIRTHTVQVGVTGLFGNVVSLITRLQERPQKVLIDSLELEALEEDSSALKCVACLTIHTFQGEEAVLDE